MTQPVWRRRIYFCQEFFQESAWHATFPNPSEDHVAKDFV